MKKLLLFSFLFLSLATKAQVFTTSLTAQEWAGGFCCKSVSYVLAIKGNPAEMEKLVVKAVCVDGKYFDQLQASPIIVRDSLAYCTYTFGYRTDPADSVSTCSNEGRIYLEGGKFLMIESRTQLPYLAMP